MLRTYASTPRGRNRRHRALMPWPSHPAFSQGVQVSRGASLLVVGGQNGVDAEGVVVSPDFGAQAEQALRNVLAILAEGGAMQADVVKLTI
jgi:2-iminobutanoate/2-iminopropanoate deaminase